MYHHAIASLIVIVTFFTLFSSCQKVTELSKTGTSINTPDIGLDHSKLSQKCSSCHESKRPANHPKNLECGNCHVPGYDKWQNPHKPTPTSCTACHENFRPPAPHTTKGDCKNCHLIKSPTNKAFIFVHDPNTVAPSSCNGCHEAKRPTELVGSFLHSQIGSKDCVNCHLRPGISWADGEYLHDPKPTNCAICHRSDQPTTQVGNFLHSIEEDSDCAKCHLQPGVNWESATYSHNPKPNTCSLCHESKRPIEIVENFLHSESGKGDCISCHLQPGVTWKDGKFDHSNQPASCSVCHESKRPVQMVNNFLHSEAGIGDCIECHKNPGVSWSGGAYAHSPSPNACSICHSSRIPLEIINFFSHITATSQIDCKFCHTQPGITWEGGDYSHAAPTPSCTLCHNNNTFLDPETVSCNRCHSVGINPLATRGSSTGLVAIPTTTGASSAGAHNLHARLYGYPCSACHHGGMPQSPIIEDYRLQMGFDLFGFSGAGSIYNGQKLNSPYSYQGTNGTTIGSGTATTCGNLYCHSSGVAVAKSYLNPSVYTGPNQTSPTWDGKTSCTSCHDYGPSYPNRSPKANSHARHLGLFSNPHTPNSDPNPCHICHYTTTTDGKTITNKANHVNRKYDVVPNTNVTFHQNSNTAYPVTFTYSYDPGGGSCSNISCHTNLISKTHAWGLPQTVTQSLYYTAGNSCGDVILHEGASGGVPPYTYHIDWESDGVIDHVGPNILITHTYNDTSAGKTITSFARDANASKSGIRTTTVSFTTTTNVLPTVSISLSIVGQTVTITDQSFDPDYNACGHHENPPTNYSHAIIDWGPGSYIHYPFNQPLTNTPAGQQFSFVYPGPGKYLIYYGVYDNVISYPEFHDPISVTIE